MAKGDTFTFYVNGVTLGSHTDSRFGQGDVALFAGTYDEAGIQISFDNLEVWALK